ncbi:Gram-negative bacterial tonB protein [compost metagenome]
MSNLSIYETRWINLVFEGKNKEYGAYQLRQQSTKTSVLAFFTGLLFLASAVAFIMVINNFSSKDAIKMEIPAITITPIELSDIIPIETKTVVQPVLPEVKSQTPEVPIQKDQLINPIITKSSENIPEIAKNTENFDTTSIPSDGKAAVGVNASPTTSGTGTGTTNAVDTGNAIVASVALDKLPEFPGGINKFYNYVGNNFERPDIDAINTIRVYVSFVIEKDGSMTDIQVKKDPGYGLGKEAVRVLKSLKTKWSPGMMQGKAVRTAYNLPITIQIN